MTAIWMREWMTGTVLPGLGAVVLMAALNLMRQWARSLHARHGQEVLMALVEAAEQLYGPGKGEAKRRYVRERIRAKGLQQLGREDLEAAVYRMRGK